MKKIVSVLVIILVCALAVAAFTGIFKTVKNDRDDKTSEMTDITTDNSTDEEPEADAWTFIIGHYNDFEAVSFDVDFISNGEKFVRICAEDTNGEGIDGGCLYYVREDGSTVQICDYWNCLEEDYVAIEIIPNQDLSEEFITWLEKYAISE